MKPTFYLKFVKVDLDTHHTAINTNDRYGDNPDFCKLQQWWEDESGIGEWRFIDIDWPSNDKPH